MKERKVVVMGLAKDMSGKRSVQYRTSRMLKVEVIRGATGGAKGSVGELWLQKECGEASGEGEGTLFHESRYATST